MTRLEALKAMADKVEAGDFPVVWRDLAKTGLTHQSHGLDAKGLAWDAFNGSLDAAKALHEAVLPGWEASAGSWGAYVWPKDADSFFEYGSDGEGISYSRAWLLAIIRALIAKEEAQ